MSTRIKALRATMDPATPPPIFAITSDRSHCVVELATDPMLFEGALASRRKPANYFSTEPIPMPAGRAELYSLDLAAFRSFTSSPGLAGLYYRAAGTDDRGRVVEVTPASFLALAVARRPPTPKPRSLSAGLSWLAVEGNRVVDEAGDTVVLRGVVRSGLEYTEGVTLDPTGVARPSAREAAGITALEIAEIARSWQANVVRIPLNQQSALTRPEYLSDIDTTVQLLAANGAYTLLALSRLDNLRAFGIDALGRPSMNPPLPDENSLALWRMLAERYRREPAVLYDIFNEPHVPLDSDTDFLFERAAGGEDDPAWIGRWHDWVRRIEHVVHRQNQRALVFVSGRRFGLDLRGFPVTLGNGAPMPNIVYSAHLFFPNPQLGAAATADLDRVLGAPALPAACPVFVGAWGGDGSQLIPLDALERYMRGRHRYRNGRWLGMAGWTAWSWADSPLLVERRDRTEVRGGVTVRWRTFEMSAGHNVPTAAGELVVGALRTMPLAASADFDRARPRGSRSRYRVSPSPPRHGDMLLVRGHDFTRGTTIEFASGGNVVPVGPTARLPFLLVVSDLPTTVPLGPAMLTVVRPDGARSEPVAVTVTADPPQAVTVLMPGAAKPSPYTIAFVAIPRVVTTAGVTVADPIMTQRPRFNHAVARSLQALFAFAETCLHPYADEIRVVARFDPAVPAAAPLARRNLSGRTVPDTANITAYLAAAALPADVCLAVFRGPAFGLAVARAATDALPGLLDPVYIYDGAPRRHPASTAQPGVVAIHAPPTSAMTPLHEFLHASSSNVHGDVDDLYEDVPVVLFEVNRKRRAAGATPLPVNFARYNGRDRATDLPEGTYPGRGGIGYPAGWRSYGAALIDRRRPNVMDNYYKADDLRQCVLDALTRRFLRDRIESKMRR